MDDLKDVVAKVLEKQGVLGKLRAELRANVFKAIDTQDQRANGSALSTRSDCPQRKQLMSLKEGVLLASLVREYLEWCNLHFTIKVYDPELSCGECSSDRNQLIQKLDLGNADDGPLLLSVLKAAQAKGGQPNVAAQKTTDNTQPQTAVMAAATGTGLRLVPLETAPDSNTAPAFSTAVQGSDFNTKLKLQSPSGSGSLDDSNISSPCASPTPLSPTGSRPSNRPFINPGPAGFSSAASSKPAALTPISTKAPAAPEPPRSLPTAEANYSYTESIEIESDEDLTVAEVEQDDDEFDYSQLLGAPAKKDAGDTSTALQPTATAPKPRSSQRQAEDDWEEQDSEASLSLSSSALSEPGRIRARKNSLPPTAAAAVPKEEEEEEDPRPVPEPEPSQTSPDISQELPSSPKPAKLNPLPLPTAKLGPLPPLGPLAPLKTSGGLPPLKDGPMAITKSLSLDKPRPGSSEDLKEELRRSGLISSTDTITHSASQSQELVPTDIQNRAPHHKVEDSSLADSIFTPTPSQSLELPMDAPYKPSLNTTSTTPTPAGTAAPAAQTAKQAARWAVDDTDSDEDSLDLPMGTSHKPAPAAANPHTSHAAKHAVDFSDSDDDSLDLPMSGSRKGAPAPTPAGFTAGAPQAQQEEGEADEGLSLASSASSVDVNMEPSAKSVLKTRAGVYDAEMTVTSSLDIADEVNLELEAPDEHSSALLPDEDSRQHSWLGRGISLDFRETGLSASDRSGELDLLISQGDYLEPAENTL